MWNPQSLSLYNLPEDRFLWGSGSRTQAPLPPPTMSRCTLVQKIRVIWVFCQMSLYLFFPLQTWPCSLFKTRIHLNILGLYKLFDMTIIVLLFLMMTSLTWLSLQRCEWNGWSCPPSFQTTNIPSRGDKYSVFQQTNITLLIKQLVSLRQQIIWFTSCHNFLLFLESIHKL